MNWVKTSKKAVIEELRKMKNDALNDLNVKFNKKITEEANSLIEEKYDFEIKTLESKIKSLQASSVSLATKLQEDRNINYSSTSYSGLFTCIRSIDCDILGDIRYYGNIDCNRIAKLTSKKNKAREACTASWNNLITYCEYLGSYTTILNYLASKEIILDRFVKSEVPAIAIDFSKLNLGGSTEESKNE